jgi:hypothetical protein
MDHYVGYPTCNDVSTSPSVFGLIGEVLALDAEWRSSNGAPRLDVRTISGAQLALVASAIWIIMFAFGRAQISVVFF